MEALQSIAVVFVLMATGYVMRRCEFPSAEVWPSVERLCYYVLFPCLLTISVATAPLATGDGTVWMLMIAIVGSQVLTALVALPILLLPNVTGPDFTSVVQGAIRFNAYAVFGVLAAVQGIGSESLLAPSLPFIIIMANIISVTVLSIWGEGAQNDDHGALYRIWHGLYSNPLILASILGLIINIIGLPIPKFLDEAMRHLGAAGLGLALLAVGAATRLRGHSISSVGLVLVSSILNLVIWPLIYFALACTLQLPDNIMQVGLITTMAPTASTAYILARQMGGNAPLMAAIAAGQTLLSMATMIVWLQWYG